MRHRRLVLPSESVAEFALLASISLVLALVLWRPFSRIGFTGFETGLICAAPLLASMDADLFHLGTTVLAVNAAGFLVPLAVSLKVVLEGRAPLAATLGATAIVSAVSYASSFPIAGHGIMLRYQIPALAACAIAVVVARARFEQAGPVAFISGTMGVTVGADAFRMQQLLALAPAERVVVGGAGALDGIFLVGVLATLLAFLALVAWTGVRATALRLVKPKPVPVKA